MKVAWLVVSGSTAALALSLFSCSSTDGAPNPLVVDAGSESSSPIWIDGGHPTGPDLPNSNIKHVVIIVQENHSFDAYFGNYCTAAAGSNPTCNDGPACCEAAPAHEPGGYAPVVLDDAENGAHDPDHSQACELSEMDNGLMDKYATGETCSSPLNFAVAATDGVIAPYIQYASQYALADRYFQPIVGQTSSNDMYLADAKYEFTDNAYEPAAPGHNCTDPLVNTITYTGQLTVADLLVDVGVSFADFAMGFDAMYAVALCPTPPNDCPITVSALPCVYDPGDVPFEFYAQFQSNHTYMKDYDDDFIPAVATGTMPAVSFVKAVMYRNEHPGYGDTISKGVTYTTDIISSILNSAVYAENTLILLTWDEGGGFFDHVTPPATSKIDNQPYGTRVPMLAIGKFAKKNFVSHVQMEHSSIVKFLEQNFTGVTGQLNNRDTEVNDIGSMLDPAMTGYVIPEN